jgi:hypothetical protein
MSDNFDKLEQVTRAVESVTNNRLLMGCITIVVGLVTLAVYIKFNGPVM